MSIYHNFAYDYDDLIDKQRYQEWIKLIEKHSGEFQTILDLGCGTSTLLVELLKRNSGSYGVGLDISEDMLIVGYDKLIENNLIKQVQLFVADITDFDLNREFDVIVCLCDTINYLQNQELLIDNAYQHLKSGGYFIFDTISLYYCQEMNGHREYFSLDYENDFEWETVSNESGELIHIIKHCDYEEKHYQKTYSKDKYIEMIEKSGFEIVEIYTDFREYKNDGLRNIFVVQKN